MARRKKTFRVEIDYLMRDYDAWVLSSSEPVKNLETGLQRVADAITLERCADDTRVPARVKLIEYSINPDTGEPEKKVILSNDQAVNVARIRIEDGKDPYVTY